MKITVIIQSIKQAISLKDCVDAFIVPIDRFSVNYGNTFSLDDVKNLKVLNKEIFVAVNKNIHNDELSDLEELLMNLDKLGVSGIIFYDIAVVNLKRKLGLKTPLVWAQEHLTTNYGTVNYWYDKGAKYAYLSSELTKKEIDEIALNSKATLFLNVFGYVPMFTSRRHLVRNYLEYFDLNDKSLNKTIYKEEKHYPISDGENGTTVYSDYVLNCLDEEFTNIGYLVFNSYLIDSKVFEKVIIDYRNKSSVYDFPFNHGFLYKETFYKVKNNE